MTVIGCSGLAPSSVCRETCATCARVCIYGYHPKYLMVRATEKVIRSDASFTELSRDRLYSTTIRLK